MLVLALAAVVVAILQLRQGGHRRRQTNDATVESQNNAIGLNERGWLLYVSIQTSMSCLSYAIGINERPSEATLVASVVDSESPQHAQ